MLLARAWKLQKGASATVRELTPAINEPAAKKQRVAAICDAGVATQTFEGKVTHDSNMSRDDLVDALKFIEPLAFSGTSLNALIEKVKEI